MVVEFSFGSGITVVLPKQEETFAKKIVTFLSEDKDLENFRDNLDIALSNARRKGNEEELQAELSKVLEKVLKDEELSLEIYKSDGEAFAEYMRGDAEKNKQFAEENSLYEIFTDNDKYLEMIGATPLQYGRDLEDLPPFDIDTFLGQFGYKETYSEDVGRGIFTLRLGAFTKNMNTLLEAYQNNPEEVLKVPDFINNLNFQFTVNRGNQDEKYDYYIEIPEQPRGIEDFAEKIRQFYINYIRKELGIRSGGFIPEGATYTIGGESKVEYKPYATRTIEIDASKHYQIKGRDRNKEFMDKLKGSLNDPESFEMEFYAEVLSPLMKSDYIKKLVDDLTGLKDLKAYQIKATVLTPKIDKSKFKMADVNNKLDAILSAFRKLRINIELRVAQIGRFDFSYYSKAGEIKKDKMNDHLNEVRTKVKYLGNFGVEGGI